VNYFDAGFTSGDATTSCSDVEQLRTVIRSRIEFETGGEGCRTETGTKVPRSFVVASTRRQSRALRGDRCQVDVLN
jgi:hypothetical protein